MQIFAFLFFIFGVQNLNARNTSFFTKTINPTNRENITQMNGEFNKSSFWFNFFSRKTRSIPFQISTLEELYEELSHLQPCNRTLQSPLIRQLLNEAVINLEKNLTAYSWLIDLAPKITYLPYAKGFNFILK